MKIDMVELRQLVSETLRRTLTEAKKRSAAEQALADARGDGDDKKSDDIQRHTEKAELLRRDKHVRGTGYMHMNNGDFSKPLGTDNLYRRQGSSNFGGYTGESREKLKAIVEQIVAEELRVVARGTKR